MIPGFAGPVVTANDLDYDDVRKIWNGAVDRRPAFIARCTGTADVLAAVRFARERDLLVSVRGGGHGVTGTSLAEGGVVIDLSLLKGVAVDPEARTCRVQPGVLLGELDRATQPFGLAVPSGIVTHTGVAGLTLGGGIGWLMRRYGLTIDNLLRTEVVTAEGELLRASDDENADLFWGLRGGGGNFGVVTSFEFRLRPVGPTVLAGPVFYPMEAARQVLTAYREFIANVPDDYTSIVILRKAPFSPSLPDWLRGRPVVMVTSCWAGSIEAGEAALREVRSLRPALLDLLRPKPFLAHQAMLDDGVPHGLHYFWKSLDLTVLHDDVIEALAAHSLKATSSLSAVLVFQLGGAVSRVPEHATAYTHRNAGHVVNINTVYDAQDPDPDRHRSWARSFFSDLEAFRSGIYVNFLGDDDRGGPIATYGAQKHERLAALKARYDPSNFFRLNHNIRPVAFNNT